jgi:hypothetical protein
MGGFFVMEFVGYPRTRHIEGSGLQNGDTSKDLLSLNGMRGGYWVIEEKVDGANAAFSFDAGGNPLIQSRGGYLSMERDVFRERHFNEFKSWISHYQDELLSRIEDRYVVFGEWMGALHSVFYDDLPHLFLEFDVWDRKTKTFLSTPARRELLADTPVQSVPVLANGEWTRDMHPKDFIGPSVFRTEGDAWLANLKISCDRAGDNYEQRLSRLYKAQNVEGLYLKHEVDGVVVERAKWVEPGFVQTILDANVHWQSAFMVPNMLGCEVPGLYGAVVRNGWVEGNYDADNPQDWHARLMRRMNP